MKHINQAVIVAGGLGTRMRPLTLTTPKPMVEINGKPFLEYLIRLLVQNGIQEIVILTGYLHEKIENYFGDGSKFGISIRYSLSPVEDNTGTRLRKAKKLLKTTFLLLYSDNYWPLNLEQLESFYDKQNTLASVVVYRNRYGYTKNNMFVNDHHIVEGYGKHNSLNKSNGVDIGFFILNKKVVDFIPKENVSLEKTLIPELIARKELSGFLTDHRYYGLSNLERIPDIEKFFTPKKVIFLDRDGVINKKAKKAQYITKWKDFIFLPKAKKTLQLLQKKGYEIYIVTNQPGIVRGMMTQEDLEEIHANLLKELKKIGVNIRQIYVCKHGWDDGCFCRKPQPGMFFEAASDHAINLYEAYCVGDDERDILAGNQSGCRSFLVNKSQTFSTIVMKFL